MEKKNLTRKIWPVAKGLSLIAFIFTTGCLNTDGEVEGTAVNTSSKEIEIFPEDIKGGVLNPGVTIEDISQVKSPCGANELLEWNGSSWICLSTASLTATAGAVPASGVQAGTLPVGVLLPSSQVTGAINPATQIGSGALNSSVTMNSTELRSSCSNNEILQADGSGNFVCANIPSAPVTSVYGRTGVVVALAGDYTANQINNTAAGSIAATNVQAAINELDSEKLALAGGTMTGSINMGSNVISNVGTPVAGTDATTKAYVDAQVAGAGDDLGDHIATQNIQLGSRFLSGDGGNEGIAVNSDGEVGVGTSNPQGFEIGSGRGIVHLESVNRGAELNLDSAGSSSSYRSTISFTNNGTRVGYLRSAKSNTGLIDGTLDFGTHDGTSLVQRMRITRDGNVGIGTTTPTDALDVEGSIALNGWLKVNRLGEAATASVNLVSDDGENNRVLGRKTVGANLGNRWSVLIGNDTLESGSEAGSDFEILRHDDSGILIDAPFFIERSSGNVGIGTSTPAEKLEVDGNIRGTELCIGADCRSAWPSDTAGTVTSVATGTGLTGGTITGSGTVSIANSGVDTLQLANNAVTSAKIANGTIVNADIAANTINAITKLTSSCSNNEILQANGAGNFVCAALPTPPAAPVTSVYGRTGVVVALAGDYTASQIGNIASGTVSSTNVQAAINELDSEKLALTGGTMTGSINMGSNVISNVGTPVAGTDATTKAYVDSAVAGSGGGDFLAAGTVPMTGNLRLNGNYLSGDGGNEGVFVDSTGNVGIGTTAPRGKIETLSDAGVLPDLLMKGSGTITADNGMNLIIDGNNDSTTSVFRIGKDSLASTGSVELFRIGEDGNVGIGTTTPDVELDVNTGTINASAICDESNANCIDLSVAQTSGTVTSVATGTGLTGGTITSSGTISIANSGVGTNQLASNAVTSVKLNSNSVNSAKIANGTIQNVDIAANTIDATTKLTSSCSNNEILQVNGSGNFICAAIPSAPVTSVYGRTGVVVALAGDYTANQVDNTAAGDISATNVQAAINELDSEKLALTGGTVIGNITMSGADLRGLPATPATAASAASKAYVDSVAGGGGGGGDGHSLDAADGTPVDAVYVDNDGKVGIGTNTPAEEFDIVSANPAIVLQDNDQVASNSFVQGYVSMRDSTGTEYGWVGSRFSSPAWGGDISVVSTEPAGKVQLITDAGIGLTVNHVGNVGIGTNNVGANKFSVSTSQTETGIARLMNAYMSVDPASNISGTSKGIELTVAKTGTANTSTLEGTDITAQVADGFATRATGVLAQTYLNSAGSTNYAKGVDGRVTNFGAVSQEAIGVFAEINNQSSGTINRAYGFYADIQTFGSITNSYGVYVAASGSGTVISGYGVYIDDMEGTSSQYGMYQRGADDVNYFAGDVGIGTNSPSYNLHVNGSVAGVGAYNQLSDRRFKRGIASVNEPIEKLQKLNGVYFDWKRKENPEMKFPEGRDMGLIAQDVQAIFPEAVSEGRDGILSVAYTKLIGPIVEAIKSLFSMIVKQSEKIESLEQRSQEAFDQLEIENKELKKKNEELEKRMLRIEQMLQEKP